MRIRDQKLHHYARENPSAHGGAFQRTRLGRSRARPLSTFYSIHLTLRSSRARGAWSFRQPHHAAKVQALTKRFAKKYGVYIFSFANVGNHLHFHLKLGRSSHYKPFIRALTASIAMAVTGASRWKPAQGKFWDQRPFTCLVQGIKSFLRVEDYVAINELEGYGIAKNTARWILSWRSRGNRRGAG